MQDWRIEHEYSSRFQAWKTSFHQSCVLPHLSTLPIFKFQITSFLVLFWFVSHPNLPLEISLPPLILLLRFNTRCSVFLVVVVVDFCLFWFFLFGWGFFLFWFGLSFSSYWGWAGNTRPYKKRLNREVLLFSLLLKHSTSSKSFPIVSCVAHTYNIIAVGPNSYAKPGQKQQRSTFPGSSQPWHVPFTHHLHGLYSNWCDQANPNKLQIHLFIHQSH